MDLSSAVDVERGLIDRRIFTDPEIYELELERVFGRSWLVLGHESQVSQVGSFVATYMAEDPVLLVRQRDGGLAAFLNSCRHRGMKVCRADVGTTTAFRCAYHGWIYGLDGSLLSVPSLENYGEVLQREQWGLVRVPRVESYGGFVFGNWDEDAPPLAEALGEIKFLLDPFVERQPGGSELVMGVQRWLIPGNWKLAAEQFANDMYHSFILHASAWQSLAPEGVDLGSMVLPSAGNQMTSQGSGGGWFYDPEGSGAGALGPVLGADFLPPATRAHVGEVAASGPIGCHATIFPNFSFLGAFRVARVWHPRGPNQMEVWSWVLVDKAHSPELKAAWRRFASVTFGPTGTFEQDDGEIWDDCQKVSHGRIARRVPLNYQMGLGRDADEHPIYPGRVNHVYSDNAARGFYEHWRKLMEQPNDRVMASLGEMCPRALDALEEVR